MNTIEHEVGAGLSYLHARDRKRLRHPLAWEWAKEHWAEFLPQLDSPTGKLLVRMARHVRELDRRTAGNRNPEPIGPEIDALLAGLQPLESQRLNTPMRETLLATTAAEPTKIGSALARHRKDADLTLEQQAEMLGIDLEGLALLALGRLPRQRHWERDLEQACKCSGANPEVLATVLLPNRLGRQ